MPVLDQQKRLRMIDAGLDPDQYDDIGDITPESEPIATGATPKMQQTVSPITSFRQEAIRSGPVAAGALAVGAKVTGATAPFIGPWSIPAGILAGVGTAIGGNYLQNKIVAALPDDWTDSYKESYDQNYAQNPISSALGSAGANLIAMKPDPKSVGVAAKALVKPFRSGLPLKEAIGAKGVLSAAEKNALLNVGLGGTIPAATTYGAEAYRQGDLTPSIDPTRLAIDVLAGSVINNPNRIGQKYLGLTPNTYDETPMSGIRGKHKKSKTISRVDDPDEKLYQAELEQSPHYQELRRRQAELEAKKADIQAAKDLKKEYKALKKAEHQAEREYQAEVKTYQEDLTKEKIASLPANPPTIKAGDNIPAPKRITKAGKEMRPDFTRVQQYDNLENRNLPETEAEKAESDYDKGIRRQEESRLQEESNLAKMQEGAKEQGISFKVSEAWKKALTKLGAIRNVELQTGLVKDDSGKEIAGQTTLREGLKKVIAKINPNKASVDSLPHELYHPFREDLRVNGTDGDKALILRVDDAISKSQEFKDWYNALDADSPYKKSMADAIEEFNTTKVGEDFVKRHLGTDKKGPVGNALSDIWSHIKTRFGDASEDDLNRILSHRLTSDPTFSERFGGPSAQPKVTGATSKSQEESRLKPIKATFRGEFTNPRTGAKLRQYDLEEPIINKDGEEIHPAGSTVSEGRFTENGYEIPARTKQQESSRLTSERDDDAFYNYAKDKAQEFKQIDNEVQTDLEYNAGSKMPKHVQKWLASEKNDETVREVLENMGFDGDIINEAISKRSKATEALAKSVEGSNNDAILKDKTRLAKNQEGSRLAEETRYSVPSGLGMTIDRDSTSLNSYYNWLREVKGLSQLEAGKIVNDIAEATGKNVRRANAISHEPAQFVNRQEVAEIMSRQIPENERIQERSRLSEESNLVDDESKKAAATSPVDIDTLPKSQYDVSRLPGFRTIRANVDRLGDKFPELAQGVRKFYDQQKNLMGQILNPFSNTVREHMDINSFTGAVKNFKEYFNQDSEETKNVVKYLWAHQDNEKLPTLSDNEEAILKAWQDAYAAVKAEHRKRMEGVGKLRDISTEVDDPLYFPNRAKLEIVKELTQHPNSDRSKALRKEFIEYQQSKGATEKKAIDNYAEFIKGFNKKDLELASQYGPIDRSEDYGLPRSWRDESFLNTAQHYLDRTVRRFAYNDAIQRSGLQQDWDTASSIDDFKPIVRDIQGSNTIDSPLLNQLMGVARAFMLGTGTGINDFASALTLGWQHQQNLPSALKASLEGIKNLKQGIADASDYGRIRPHMNVMEWDGGYNDGIAALRRFRDVVSDATGRNFLDQAARGMSMEQGKYATINYHEQYQAGELSKQGQKFFDDFAEGVDWKKAELTQEDVKQIASRYVDSAQGNYNYTGLPAWSVEGQAAPFFGLARWSIEKSNNYIKNVVNPAINDGNWTPFLMSTLGMVAGGTLVNEIREKITGRKGKTATYAELSDASKRGKNTSMATTYKMLGLASSAGHVGFLGDILKSIMDVTYGRNRPQVYNNVLLELAENTAMTTGNFLKSTADNGFEPELLMDSIAQILEDNLQTYRIIQAQLGAETKRDIEQANKLRDLRVFNTLEGNAIRDLSSPFSRPPEDTKMKKFKRAETYEEAAQVLPELLARAVQRADGSVEKLTKELSRIKRNSYQTMPNPERWPLSAREYYLFLARTQGPKAAVERMQDYIRRNQINRAKTDMVPDVN